MVRITELEGDILGQMAWDSHNVGEIIGFIRAANPTATDYEVFRILRDLLSTWTDRGWLALLDKPNGRAGLSSIGDLLALLDREGPDVVSEESEVELPEVTLTRQAFVDVEWLHGAV